MNPTRKKPPNQWKAGQSGNPKGRPPGVSAITKMRESLAADVPDILAGLVAAAKVGDVQAARMVLERVLPPLKAAEATQPLSLPNGTMTEQGRAVLASVAAGELAVGQGAQLLGAIAGLARVVEIDDLNTRITKLENQHAST